MRRTILTVVLLLVMVPGCSGVILNAEYSQLLDETSAWTREVARRARAGQLDPNIMSDALHYSATHWERFQDARGGRKSKEK